MLLHRLVLLLLLDGATSFVPSSLNSLVAVSTKSRRPSSGKIFAAVDQDVSQSSGTASTTSAESSNNNPFASFDYHAHWYPVIWAQDLILNEPTKVTVFDVDYVVAKISDTEVICLEDRCPHKAAALSEGRVTSTGNFQCAYHGWAFDGKNGECVDIPQIASTREDPDASSTKTSKKKIPSRSCAQAVPAQIFQHMVWLFPGGNLEQALQAPPPPSVPEYDLGFQMSPAVRDMPVDWPILVSNICDPDHGLFAHQAKPFDMYSASPEFPMQVTEDFPNSGKGYVIKSKVDASDKLLEVDQTWRDDTKQQKKVKKQHEQKQKGDAPWATSSLFLPNHLQLKRVDKSTNTTNFVSIFYICPVGVGRSRFMSAGLAKKAPPRWMTKLFLDNFLDQDTYLLATQQKFILEQEAKDVKEIMSQSNSGPSSSFDPLTATMQTRRNMFCLCSPTERFGAKIEQFWDSTLLKSPNRIPRLLQLQSAGAFASTPSREFVLDRKAQNLDIVPDSQDVVRNCKRISFAGKFLGIAALVTKFALKSTTPQRNAALALTCGASFLASWAAKKVEKEYHYKYTDEMRRKDMNKIPKDIWVDK